MPAAVRASRNTVSANLVGEGTGTAAVCGFIPTGRLPESVAVTEPSGLVVNSGESNDGLDPAAEVVTRFMNLIYEVRGEVVSEMGSPSFAPGVPTVSMTLSLIMMEDMTTSVPPSRGPSGKRLVSINTRPSIL